MSAVMKNPNFIGGVPGDQLMHVWKRVQPLLKRVVLPASGETVDSVRNDIQARRRQLWVINDFQAIVVTAILDRPADRILHVPFIVGENLALWIDDWRDTMEEYARANKCDAIEFNGRQGWRKIGENYTDYKPLTTIFRREL